MSMNWPTCYLEKFRIINNKDQVIKQTVLALMTNKYDMGSEHNCKAQKTNGMGRAIPL